MKSRILYIVIFSCLVSFSAHSQNVVQTFALANSLFEQADYQLAINHYQRVLFFEQVTFRFESYSRLAKAHFKLNDLKKAGFYYDLAYYSVEEDSLSTEMGFNKIQILILQGRYNEALIDLFSLDYPETDYFNRKSNFYLGVANFALGEYAISEAYFLNISKDSLFQAHIHDVFLKNKKVERINPKVAKTLSMLAPGLGQFYLGEFKSGLNSVVLTSAFVVLGFSTAINYSIFNAVYAVAPWYFRYYVGGYQNSEQHALNKIAKKRTEIYTELLDLIADSNPKI